MPSEFSEEDDRSLWSSRTPFRFDGDREGRNPADRLPGTKGHAILVGGDKSSIQGLLGFGGNDPKLIILVWRGFGKAGNMKAPLPSMQIPHSHHFRPRRGSWLRQQHDRLNTAERIAPLERSDPDLEVLAFFFQGTDPRFQPATLRIEAGDAFLESIVLLFNPSNG